MRSSEGEQDLTRSLSRVARQLGLSYGVSDLQSIGTKARGDDLAFANKLLRDAVPTFDRGLLFRSGIFSFSWSDMCVITITDACFGNEKELVGDVLEPHLSHDARIICAGGPHVATEGDVPEHII